MENHSFRLEKTQWCLKNHSLLEVVVTDQQQNVMNPSEGTTISIGKNDDTVIDEATLYSQPGEATHQQCQAGRDNW